FSPMMPTRSWWAAENEMFVKTRRSGNDLEIPETLRWVNEVKLDTMIPVIRYSPPGRGLGRGAEQDHFFMPDMLLHPTRSGNLATYLIHSERQAHVVPHRS